MEKQKNKLIRRISLIGLICLVVFVASLAVWSNRSASVQAAWFDDNWGYRVAVPVSAHTSAETGVYWTPPNIDTSDTSRFSATSGNVRWTDASGNGLTLTNNGVTTFVVGKFGNGSEHVPASSQHFSTATTISAVKTVAFWTNPDSTTNYYVSLTSGAYITSSSGVVSATGFTAPKIYIDGVEGTTIAADSWQLVTVVSDTGIDANQFYVGRQGANYFDGTDDYAVTGNLAMIIANGSTTTNVSWGGWFNPATSVASKTLLHKTNEFRLTTDSSSRPQCEIYSGSWQTAALGTTALPLGSWSHVLCTYDGSFIRTYVNGVQVAYQAETDNLTGTANAFNIARDSASSYYEGQVDEVKLWNYPLTAYQVRTEYNQNSAIRFGPSSGAP